MAREQRSEHPRNRKITVRRLGGSAIMVLVLLVAFYAWQRVSQMEASLQVERENTQAQARQIQALQTQLDQTPANFPAASNALQPAPQPEPPPPVRQTKSTTPRTARASRSGFDVLKLWNQWEDESSSPPKARRALLSPAPFDWQENEPGRTASSTRLERQREREQEELKRKVEDLERKERFGF